MCWFAFPFAPYAAVTGQLRLVLGDVLYRQGKSNSCFLELLAARVA